MNENDELELRRLMAELQSNDKDLRFKTDEIKDSIREAVKMLGMTKYALETIVRNFGQVNQELNMLKARVTVLEHG